MDWLWLLREFNYLAEMARKRDNRLKYWQFTAYWDVTFQVYNLQLQDRLAR